MDSLLVSAIGLKSRMNTLALASSITSSTAMRNRYEIAVDLFRFNGYNHLRNNFGGAL